MSVNPRAVDQQTVDHILRPRLPWREDDLTECGRPAHDVKSTITVEELQERIKRLGQQRTAFTICMTCNGRASSFSETWENHPIGVLVRELQRVGVYAPTPGYPVKPATARMVRELRAIAALIAEHREEFDGYVQGVGETVDLATARRRRRTPGGRRSRTPGGL